jgi:hypothetical protein
MRLAWATDIHLNFLTATARRRFLEPIGEQTDALVVTADIAESNSLGAMLQEVDSLVQRPICFVLGIVVEEETNPNDQE